MVYVNRPESNRPEWMPLDNSLNNDIQLALSLHFDITAYLDDGDIRKFSFLHLQLLCQAFNAYITMLLVAMYRRQSVLCMTVIRRY